MLSPFTRLTATLAVLSSAALIAAGCGGDDDSSSSESTDTRTSTTMTDADHGGGDAAPGATVSKAADTRVSLDRLLGEHAQLATLATTRALAGGKDADAAAAALVQNGEDLAELIGSVYGEDARDEFNDQWQAHIGYLVAYTQATATKDAKAKAQAVKQLGEYVTEFGAFLAETTGLPAKAVQDGLAMHIDHHAGIVDAYAAKDYAKANELSRESFQHMIMVGDTLATAIAKQQQLDNGEATKAGVDTRVALGTLLSEHTALAFQATTDALAGSPDFDAAAAALGENSTELAALIGSVYGDAAKSSFDKQWQAHIGYLVEYTTAAAKDDATGKAAATKKLDGYVESFGAFLAMATGLPTKAVQDGLAAHVTQHAGSIDGFADGDFDETYELGRGAYAHMWELGDTFAAAIVQQQAAKS